MKIEIDTKYNIGDWVWLLDDNQIRKTKIFGISAESRKRFFYDYQTNKEELTTENQVLYELNGISNSVYEDKIFPTKEGLVEFLSDNYFNKNITKSLEEEINA
jgi:hypothetical protein